MTNATSMTALRNPSRLPIPGGNKDWEKPIHPHERQAAAKPTRRRFNWVTLGFWVGGLTLGTAGGILGACTSSRHPVAVTISALWWGIYLACFGASIGALFGLWMKRATASPSQGSDGAGMGVSDSSPYAPRDTPGGRGGRSMVFDSAASEGVEMCRRVES
jgi:hypothetical protein